MIWFNSQEDLRAFRRQLEARQPVIDANLTQGRHFIATEPPVSDGSDSEETMDPTARDARELNRSIRREVGKLGEKWANIHGRLDVLQQRNNDLQAVRSFCYSCHTPSNEDPYKSSNPLNLQNNPFIGYLGKLSFYTRGEILHALYY